jgi:hypothetical protein
MTPTVLVALIERMSPQELINNLGSLRQHGAFDNPDVKALIENKLEQAKTDERVSAYKAKQAIAAAGVSADVAEKLDAVTEAQVKAKGTIVRSTALLLDKSGSMTEAIEIGKRLGSLIAGICQAELYAYAFDTIPYPIETTSPALADWERALQGIQAGGNTSCGVAVEFMRRKRQVVEQIVIVTDEEENTSPLFVEALQQYREELKADPHVVFVKVRGARDQLEQECQRARIACDAYQFTGDYYALPNLVSLLTRPTRLDLLLEIMAYPLPQRRPA